MPLQLVKREKLSKTEIERFKEYHEEFEWLSQHSEEIWEKYKGKYIAIAHREVFTGVTYQEAEVMARNKYPDSEPLVWHIPLKQRVMVY